MGKGDSQRTGGSRGGRDQFDWDQVREDKHRENYIGHAVLAPKGRWQNGKDLSWYARARKDESLASLREERARAREMEDDMMRARLGMAPAKRGPAVGSSELQPHEQAKLLARGGGGEEDGETGEKGDARFDAERISGVGSFAMARRAEVGMIKSKMAPLDRLEGAGTAPPPPPPPPEAAAAAPRASGGGGGGFIAAARFGGPRPGWAFKMGEAGLGYYREGGGGGDGEEREERRRAKKAARKEAKQAKKRERKERKQAKKEGKKRKRQRDEGGGRGSRRPRGSSSGSSSSSEEGGARRRHDSDSEEAPRRRHDSSD